MAAGRVLTAAGDGDGGGEVLELSKGRRREVPGFNWDRVD
jgi:hypothetical protein